MKKKIEYPVASLGTKIRFHDAARLLRDRDLTEFRRQRWACLRFDGGADDNGKPHCVGSYGFELTDADGFELAIGSGEAEGSPVTVNTAEWSGLIAGLEAATEHAIYGLMIEGDSRLVIRQVCGEWQARDQLLTLRDRALDVLARLNVGWSAGWIPREFNSVCDSLAGGVKNRKFA
jgi:ribonuclease HI